MADSPTTVNNMLNDDPLLGIMWEEYELSRAQQWVHFTHKSKDGKKEYPVNVAYPSHIATWPYGGGVADQPYFYVKIFRAFLEGEREGTLRKIERMRKD